MKKITTSEPDISCFHGDNSLDENGRMTGIYELEKGTFTKYSLSLQKPTAQYLVRGSISLLDPSTGTVMKVKNRKGITTKPSKYSETDSAAQKDNADEDSIGKKKAVIQDARITVLLKTDSPDALRKAIAEKSKDLNNRYLLLLLDSKEKSVPTDQMTLSTAILLLGDKYVQKCSSSAGMQHTRKLRLNRMAKLLPSKELGKLTLTAVRVACDELGGKWRTYVKEACDFLDYIFKMRRDAFGYNIFHEYLVRNPTVAKRNIQRLQKNAANSDILSQEEEKKLNQIISDGVSNGALIGILLVKEACFSAAEACALTWKDVLPIENAPDALIICYHRAEIAGATHDYSFPIVGFAVRILLKRKSWLIEQGFSEREILSLHVASSEQNPSIPLEPKALTAACRNLLHNAGVGYAELAGLQSYRQGAGITLLHKTFQHRVEDICCLKHDPAAVSFLQHKSLVNMLQANHYRCFTDATARNYLMTALRRDKRFENERRHANCVRKKKQGIGEQITVYPESSKYRTHAVFRIHLKPGQMVELSSPHGCFVAVKDLNKS